LVLIVEVQKVENRKNLFILRIKKRKKIHKEKKKEKFMLKIMHK